MNIPTINGDFPQSDTIFYVAADENYFNLHGKPLINSIKVNFQHPIHFHLYNPSDQTIKYCQDQKVSVSYENFNENLVNTAFKIYQVPSADWELLRRRGKMLGLGDSLDKLHSELVKTYYACSRFVRLHELLTKPTCIIMLDADSLVRRPFSLPDTTHDIHIFEKNHKKHVKYTQHLASTIFYTGSLASRKLIRDHANLILEEFEKDTFYWFLDQETLDIAIQKYKKLPLDKTLVDFDMNIDSYIWCAKGPRKQNKVWINEVEKFYSL